ncbi:MAG: phosphonate C-P lyase system protein PhnG [Eubacteriales bacterium]
MDKNRLFKIMSKTDTSVLKEISDGISVDHSVSVIKEPSKTLTMIKVREPVKESLFYIGEVIVSEAVVSLGGTKGMAVTMGDDFTKVLSMALIDAVFNKNLPEVSDIIKKLESLEKEQQEIMEKENAIYLKTMVNFKSMDQETVE